MSYTATYRCDKHGTTMQRGTYCPDCAEAFATRRAPDTMTGEERAAEFRWWGTIVTIPWTDLTQRFEELVGRGIWTHEYADVEWLIEEAQTRTHPTPAEILSKIPAHVQVIAVNVD